MHAFLHDGRVFFTHLAAVDFHALGIACAFQVLRLVVRTRAWRNIIQASYPDRRVRWGGGVCLGTTWSRPPEEFVGAQNIKSARPPEVPPSGSFLCDVLIRLHDVFVQIDFG